MSCRGQYSVQREVNRIARDEGGREWGKLIQGQIWRDTIRQQLLQTGGGWCDYKTGKCACEIDYAPRPGQHMQGAVL
jgi:hypothetical protein